MKRSGFTIKPKARKCAHCKQPMPPDARASAKVCGADCAVVLGRLKTKKDARKKAKIERANDAAKREKLKTQADWMREAQSAWNGYVRARDFGLPCCSCGATPDQKFGGTMDCSHYRSRGAAPHLKFHLHNAAAACVKCNRYLGGNVAALRVGLIDRLGLDKVLAIEQNNERKKFSIEYLIRIKKIFTKKAKRIINRKGMKLIIK